MYSCFYRVIEPLVKVWENSKKMWKHSPAARVPTAFLVLPNFHPCSYLNNRVFLSGNYRLIVAQRKFDVLKTNICPRSEALRANMLVLRTSDFQGATISDRLFRDINTLLTLLFTTKFSSSRLFKIQPD